MPTEQEWKNEVERIKLILPYWEAIPHPQAVINATLIKHLIKAYEKGDRQGITFLQMNDIAQPH
ncbi:hypothetical protein QGM71_01185 [Virgibacillus sp. C22-A2]|uniref:Uncharacterized protein n=1 Tax=Virgibacillus tibetensis TaxID=3042313 RepID=A0ABU6K9T6_9BACI|nr:hypothetical protein [Virgibacillus sp. C22-A2]